MRVGAEVLRLIIEEKVVMLLRGSHVEEVDAVLDAAFIKAWSIRHPDNSRTGFSDPDAMVGRNGSQHARGVTNKISTDTLLDNHL